VVLLSHYRGFEAELVGLWVVQWVCDELPILACHPVGEIHTQQKWQVFLVSAMICHRTTTHFPPRVLHIVAKFTCPTQKSRDEKLHVHIHAPRPNIVSLCSISGQDLHQSSHRFDAILHTAESAHWFAFTAALLVRLHLPADRPI